MSTGAERVTVQASLAAFLYEADALTDDQLAAFDASLPDVQEGETIVGTIRDEAILRMLALAWHKLIESDRIREEVSALPEADGAKADDLSQRSEQLLAEHECLAGIVAELVRLELILEHRDPYVGGWLRSGNRYVVELLESGDDEDDEDPDEDEAPPQAPPKLDRKKMH